MTKAKDNLDILQFSTSKQWETWLKKNHKTTPGIWLQIAKKGSDVVSINREQALDVALCYGWIDGLANKLDDDHWLQRFTPRRARSKWSQVNRDKVDALIKAGHMQPAGMAEIEAAKKDGRWDAAYAPPSTIEVPEDFAAALKKHPDAEAFFNTISKTNRYAILFRIHDAKKPETRVRRIQKFVDMLIEKKTIY